MTAPAETETVHASCVLLGEAGILIRGPAGAGKSSLARRLIGLGERSGGFARLVADDRVRLRRSGDRLIARPVPALAGLLEIRGHGLVRLPFEPACILRLVVDLDPAGPHPRLPEPADLVADLLGVGLPRAVPPLGEAAERILWQIRGKHDTAVTE